MLISVCLSLPLTPWLEVSQCVVFHNLRPLQQNEIAGTSFPTFLLFISCFIFPQVLTL